MFSKKLNILLLLIITFSLILSNFTCMASETTNCEFLINGDMEMLGTSYKIWSGDHTPETNIVHSGSHSMKLTVNNERKIYVQYIDRIVPGGTYTVSFWLYTDGFTAGSQSPYGAGVKVEFANAAGTTSKSITSITNVPEAGQWTQYTITDTAPADACGTATIHVRLQGTGTIYFDDVSIYGTCTAETASYFTQRNASIIEGFNYSKALYDAEVNYTANSTLSAFATNLINNGGFETAGNTTTTGANRWSRSGYSNEVVARTDTVAKTGTYSMKIDVPADYAAYNAPYAFQSIYSGTSNCGEDFVPGAEYILSAWIKTENCADGALYKLQANGPSGVTGTFSTPEVAYTDGEWHEMKFVFTMPAETTSLYLYIRLSGTGVIYYDDVVLGKSSNNDPLETYTKHVFYYTEEPSFDAFANIKTNIFTIAEGSTVVYSILDSAGNIVTTQTVDAAANTSATFSTSVLAVEKAEYTLKTDYIAADGSILSSHSKRIYRYDRPTALDANGNFIDNGEIIIPFFMYKPIGEYSDYAAAGITMLRENSMPLNDDAAIQQWLDKAEENNIKVLFALYGTVAGHPLQIERTKDIVTNFKNHPAIAAWMLMDEPSLHVNPSGIRTYDEMLYYLEKGYKAVRDIDDVHPVYNIETVGQFADSYERTSQMCDIFAIDPYPSSLHAAVNGSITTATQKAINAVYGERPVYMLGLAAEWSDYGKPINSAMLRYQIYDALWAGAKGAGHYLSNTSSYTNPEFSEIFLDTFKQAAASGEITEIFDHFSVGNSTVFDEGIGDGYKYRSWYKDNGDMYIAVMSKSTSAATATINLISPNHKVSIDGYNAYLVNGVSAANVTSTDNTFSVTINPGEVSLYKIVPDENINFDVIGLTNNEIEPTAFDLDIIENGDIEAALPTGFELSSNTTAERTEEKAADGLASVKLAPINSATSFEYRKHNFAVEPNTNYLLSLSMYTDSLTSSTVPSVRMIYKNADGATVINKTTYLYNSFLNNDSWKDYDLTLLVPDDANITKASLYIIFPGDSGDVYLDNLSLRKVTAFKEEQMITNTSFEMYGPNNFYTSAYQTQPINWNTGSTTYDDVYIATSGDVVPHSGNFSIGLAADGQVALNNANHIPIEYGKTYEFSVWFNGKNLTDVSSYPQLYLQTRGVNAYNNSLGHRTTRINFTDAYEKRNDGWYKLTAEYTVPEYQEGYDITKTSFAVKMIGTNGDIGYFDDISFRLKPAVPDPVVEDVIENPDPVVPEETSTPAKPAETEELTTQSVTEVAESTESSESEVVPEEAATETPVETEIPDETEEPVTDPEKTEEVNENTESTVTEETEPEVAEEPPETTEPEAEEAPVTEE